MLYVIIYWKCNLSFILQCNAFLAFLIHLQIQGSTSLLGSFDVYGGRVQYCRTWLAFSSNSSLSCHFHLNWCAPGWHCYIKYNITVWYNTMQYIARRTTGPSYWNSVQLKWMLTQLSHKYDLSWQCFFVKFLVRHTLYFLPWFNDH